MAVAERVKGHLCDSCCFSRTPLHSAKTLCDTDVTQSLGVFTPSLGICASVRMEDGWQGGVRSECETVRTHIDPVCVCVSELHPVGKVSGC